MLASQQLYASTVGVYQLDGCLELPDNNGYLLSQSRGVLESTPP
jgi:hypothetical protein